MAVSEGIKSSSDIRIHDAMSDDEEVSSEDFIKINSDIIDFHVSCATDSFFYGNITFSYNK